MCVRVPAIRARPSNRAGLAKSRPCAFSARHSPHGGREKETGKPQARPNPGPTKLGCLTIGYVFLRSPPRKRGPRSQNCRWKEWVPAFAGTSGRDIRCRPRRARPGTVPKAVFIAVPDLPRTTSAVFVTGHTDELGTLVLHRVRDTHADFRLSARPPQAGTQAFRQRVRPWAPAFAGASG